MRKILRSAGLVAVIFLFSFCDRDIPFEEIAGEIPFSFTAGINGLVTRSTDNAFEDGDMIKLCLQQDGVHKFISTYSLSGGNWTCPAQNNYWETGALNTDIFATSNGYSITCDWGKRSVTVTVPTAQNRPSNFRDSDLLIAFKQVEKPSKDPVSLEFRHAMSQICVKLDNLAEGETVSEIVFSGCCTKVLVKVDENGTFSYSEQSGDNPVIPYAAEPGSEYKAFVIPGSNLPAVTVTTNFRSQEFLPSSDSVCEGGHKYVADITLDPFDAPTSMDLNALLLDWEDGGDIEYKSEKELISGIKLDCSGIELAVGEKATINATVEPEGIVRQDVSWSSSDPSVAEVYYGSIYAKAPGTAVISAATLGLKYIATCIVTVTSSSIMGGTGSLIPLNAKSIISSAPMQYAVVLQGYDQEDGMGGSPDWSANYAFEGGDWETMMATRKARYGLAENMWDDDPETCFMTNTDFWGCGTWVAPSGRGVGYHCIDVNFETPVKNIKLYIKNASKYAYITLDNGFRIWKSTDGENFTPVEGCPFYPEGGIAGTNGAGAEATVECISDEVGIRAIRIDANGQSSNARDYDWTGNGAAFGLAELRIYDTSSAPAIKIDGDCSEWTGVHNSWTLPSEAKFTTLKTLKLAADDKYLYTYLEVEGRRPDDATPIDIFIDNDADPSTGGKLSSTDNYDVTLPYTDSGINWYIESDRFLSDDYSSNLAPSLDYGLYKYNGKDGESIFSALQNISASGVTKMMGYFDDKGTGHVEISFDRQFFGLEGKRTASIGVKLMDGSDGWSCIGILPQASAQGLSHHGQAPMAAISLP